MTNAQISADLLKLHEKVHNLLKSHVKVCDTCKKFGICDFYVKTHEVLVDFDKIVDII